MATRLYLTNTAAPYTPATLRGTWTGSNATAQALAFTPAGATANAFRSESSASVNDQLCVRFVSPGLNAGTLSGDVELVARMREGDVLADNVMKVHIFVTAGDSNTVRGTLLNNFVGTTELTAGGGNGAGISTGVQTLSSVAVQAGDRIVAEVGYRANNTLTTFWTGVVYFGGTGIDLTVGSSDTTEPGWIQFSDPNSVISSWDGELGNTGGGQADGTAVTTGNSAAGGDPWDAVTVAAGAEVTYDSVAGNTWHRFATGATAGQARAEWTSASITKLMPRIYGGFWFRIPAAALGVNNTYLMRARGGGVQTTRLSVSTGSKLQVRNTANSAAEQGAHTIVADTDYFVRYDVAVGPSAAATVELYAADGTLIETLAPTGVDFGPNSVNEIGYGVASSISNQPAYLLRGFVSSATAWPDPPAGAEPPAEGAADAGVGLSVEASGARGSAANANAGLSLVAAATGSAPAVEMAEGSAAVGLDLAAAGVGAAPAPTPAQGSADVTLSLAAAAAGRRDSAGEVDAGLALVVAAVGDAPAVAPAEGAAGVGLALAVTAAGSRMSAGVADAGLGLAVAASGSAPTVPAAQGTAAVALTLAAAAAGGRESAGTVDVPVALTVAASGDTPTILPSEGAADVGVALAVAATGLAPEVGRATGTATVGLGLTAAAAGRAAALGDADAGLTLAVAAAGGRASAGTADASLVLDVEAEGGRSSLGTADVGLGLSVAGVGFSPPLANFGTANVGLSLAVAAEGHRASTGATDVDLDLGVSASGARDSAGTTGAGLTLDVAAVGSAPVVGGASGTATVALTLDPAATGGRDSAGFVDVPLTLDPAATGVRDSAGSAAVTITISVAAVGHSPALANTGTADTGLSLTVAGAGFRPSMAQAGAALAIAVAATGQAPQVGPAGGAANVAVVFTVAASGLRPSLGTAAVDVVLTVDAAAHGPATFIKPARGTLTTHSTTAGLRTTTRGLVIR